MVQESNKGGKTLISSIFFSFSTKFWRSTLFHIRILITLFCIFKLFFPKPYIFETYLWNMLKYTQIVCDVKNLTVKCQIVGLHMLIQYHCQPHTFKLESLVEQELLTLPEHLWYLQTLLIGHTSSLAFAFWERYGKHKHSINLSSIHRRTFNTKKKQTHTLHHNTKYLT